ncbi:hypothetical protein ACWO4D_003856 [Klebsiella michiganensis]|uniref:hypothetical protein n=1 Tax=Klebsiella michiganensis TaxID=1134687 RepID=UPI0007CC7045|nr:hypothetical protein [Klebsiella michiganensis]MCB3566320.1 hypothetical protein [Klebsiella michiganensis]WBN09504.1 hypothetical protein KHV91_07860 [Klebsiella michiganensis]WDF27100.1 hypothetical protein PUO96_18575 [Klebsiella michiganensis]SBL64578.1 Uncharacterised protein [Klebsiella michiganensis]HED2927857.1 hypothetical protein [Klebsiella michiganensis]
MKTTKSKKTQYSGEITMIEFLKANPDFTTREIAVALGRGMSSVGNWAGGKNKARHALEQKWAEAVNKNEVKNG